jgi:putative membrane protein
METKHIWTDSPDRLRTMLANERTLLAYVRTSIMLAFSGITAIKIFPADPFFLVMGIILIPLALGVGLFGYLHFPRVRNRVAG